MLWIVKAAIIHLGFSLPKSSSDLPENAVLPESKTLSGQLKNRFPIWSCTTRSLPSRTCYQTRWRALTLSFLNRKPRRFTHHHSKILKSEIRTPKSEFEWLFCSLLHLSSLDFIQTPGRYPARCPKVFGLSSYNKLQAIARLASLFARLKYLSKKCSTHTIMVYWF